MASEKPTPVYAAVFFAFTTIAMLVYALMSTSGAAEMEADLKRAKDEASKSKAAWAEMNGGMNRLKELIGTSSDAVGLDQEDDETTVIGGLLKDLRDTGGD